MEIKPRLTGLIVSYSGFDIFFFPFVQCPVLFSFRLEDITLGDFKEAIDRPGMFRYHFKALDPEFGTVKEEVWLNAYSQKWS